MDAELSPLTPVLRADSPASGSFIQVFRISPMLNCSFPGCHASHGRGVSLVGTGSGFRTFTLAATLTALPKRRPSPGAKIGNCSSKPREPTGRIFLKYSISSGFWMRCTRKFAHWDSTVALTSDGRWLVMTRESPNFRPSLAILSKVSRANVRPGASPWFRGLR